MKRLTLDTFLPAGGFRFEMHALDFQRCQVHPPVFILQCNHRLQVLLSCW